MKPIYSFDVYDTCYTRAFALPTDLFIQLGNESFSHCAVDFSFFDCHVFAKCRRKAEKKARWLAKKCGRKDICLDDIYAVFSKQLLKKWPVMNANWVKEKECELEQSQIRVIPSTLEKVKKLHEQGHTLLYVSDMYLSPTIIQSNLQKLGFWSEGDRLYVSGYENATKHDGTLFYKILSDLSISAQQLHHLGDNLHADVSIPLSIGINATHFNEYYLSYREAQLLRSVNTSDYLLHSKLAAVAQEVRLHVSKPSIAGFHNLLSSMAGPILVMFVQWVIRHALDKGYEVLYFVSRDGQILNKIALEYCNQKNIKIECRYLYCSRQSLNVLDYIQGRFEFLNWMIDGDDLTVVKLLARLHLTVDDISDLEPPLCMNDNQQILSAIDKQSIFEWLIETKNWHAIKSRLVAYETKFKKYIEQEKLGYTSSAIVDVGWNLSSLRILNQSLELLDKSTKPLDGFFLGAKTNNQIVLSGGRASYFYWFDDRQDAWIYRKGASMLIENFLLMSNHGSVIGYEERANGEIVPRLSSFVEFGNDISAYHHELILKYTDFVIQQNIDNVDIHLIKNLLKRLITSPLKEEAECFQRIHLTVAQGGNVDEAVPVVRKLSFYSLCKLLKNQQPEQEPYIWLEGSLAITSNKLLVLYQMINYTKTYLRKRRGRSEQ